MIHTEMFHKMFTALTTGLWDHDCVDKVLSVSALVCIVVTVNTYTPLPPGVRYAGRNDRIMHNAVYSFVFS